jgi:hypothetical protein
MFHYLEIALLQLVTVNFWVLNLLMDPALIEDTHVLQDYVPSWMNHSLHSYMLVFTAAELVLSPRHYPPWMAVGRLMSAAVVLAYASWWVCPQSVKPLGAQPLALSASARAGYVNNETWIRIGTDFFA